VATQRYGKTTTLALTRSPGVQVECSVDRVPAARYALSSLRGLYGSSPGGMSCGAQADLLALRVPTSFGEGWDGFFGAGHSQRPQLELCATGRCSGRYTMLLDDWGLAGEDESRECRLGSCANTAYQSSVRTLFDAYGRAQGSAGSMVALLVVGRTPYDEN